MKRLILAVAAALALAGASPAAQAAQEIVYVGSYTGGTTSKGIYAFRFDTTTAQLAPIGLVAETPEPAHIWASKDGRFLYAVNWLKEGKLSAFAIDPRTGALKLLNQVSAQGALPNQVMLDPSGKVAVTVNYDTGNVAAYHVLPDGRLSESFWQDQHTGKPLAERQPGPRAHGVIFSPDGRFMYVAQLGLDRVYAYRLDAARGTITAGSPAYVETPAGSGPRRLQISPDGKVLYVNHQDDSKVSVFAVDGTTLKPLQVVTTLPAGYAGRNTTAEIIIDREGKHLYVSNRGTSTIAIYDIAADGRLTMKANVPSGGPVPRNLRLDTTGDFLLVSNQASGQTPAPGQPPAGNVVVFRIDHATCLISETGSKVSVDNAAGAFAVPAR